MDDGQIVEEAPPEQFFTAPAQRPGQGLPVQDPHPLTRDRRRRPHATATDTSGRRWSRILALALWPPAAATTTTATPVDDSGAVGPSSRPARRWRELSEAGKITVGTKFDQPLFGLQGPATARRRASTSRSPRSSPAKLGHRRRTRSSSIETVSANREPFIQDGTGRHRRRHLHDQRRPARRSSTSPGRTSWPARTSWCTKDNSDINGPDDLAGKTVCSVEGSTPAENIRTKYPDAKLDLTRRLHQLRSSRCATSRSTR